MEHMDTYAEANAHDGVVQGVTYLDGAPAAPQLADRGLDSDGIIHAAAYMKHLDGEVVDGKLETIGDILRAIGSPHTAQQVVDAFPPVLGTRREKIAALTGLLAEHADREYLATLSPVELAKFASFSIDSVLAAVVMSKVDSDLEGETIKSKHIQRIQTNMPKSERRDHSLELVGDEFIRRQIGERAVVAYVTYAPLTFDELKQKPELTEVVKEVGVAALSAEVFDQDVTLHHAIDGRWLSQLADYELDEADIARANGLVSIGSIKNTKSGPLRSSSLAPGVAEARQEFFEDLLVWGYKKHPLHKTYEDFKNEKHSLAPLSTVILSQRLLSAYDIDLVKLVKKTHGKSLRGDPEFLRARILSLEEFQLDVKRTFESDPRLLATSPERIRSICELIDMTDGLDIQTMASSVPALLGLDPVEVKTRIDYLLSLGVPAGAINKNPVLLTSRLESVQDFMTRMNDRQLNGAYIMQRNRYALGTSEKLIDERIQTLQEMGLDAVKVINGCPDVLNLDSELVRAKLGAVQYLLATIGSGMSVEEVITDGPSWLTRSEVKIKAAADMLGRSISPACVASLDPKKLEVIARNSTDTIFASLADQKLPTKFSKDGVTISDFRRVQRNIPPVERREHNLRLIADPTSRDLIGHDEIRAYFSDLPLTPDELRQYPQLAEIA